MKNKLSLFKHYINQTVNRALSGNFPVRWYGNGKLILESDNSYTLPTYIKSGEVQVGNLDTTGTLGTNTVQIDANGTLSFAHSENKTINNLITGDGQVIFKPKKQLPFDYIIVGGGGGGSAGVNAVVWGSGGGGGEVLNGRLIGLSTSITIGAGGVGANGGNGDGGNGDGGAGANSLGFGLTARGGRGGIDGSGGASGNGLIGGLRNSLSSGGGAGAGVRGSNASSATAPGDGGNGIDLSALWGALVGAAGWFGGGGGGYRGDGKATRTALGGRGGGASIPANRGVPTAATGHKGTANTGGGGAERFGDGGSGVVYVAYPNIYPDLVIDAGLNFTYSNGGVRAGDKVYKFTSGTGNITIPDVSDVSDVSGVVYTVTNANTYTGGTTIKYGTVMCGADSCLGTGDITIEANSVLNKNGFNIPNVIVNNGGQVIN